ncbi:MAG TPA: sulfurtransferase [Chloroflexota bacterium]|nr:sulfurtransferase [Chloroflexota bacterium]
MITLSETDTLVDAAWVAARLTDRDVRLVEVDVSRSAYDAGHLDGAIFWDLYKDLLQPSYRIIEAPALEQLLSRSGIAPKTTIVFHGYAAALGVWLLTYYRHRGVLLLDGSRKTWQAGGLTMTTTIPVHAPATYRLSEPDSTIRAMRDTVQEAIDAPHSLLLDARSDLEYRGERFWPSLPPQGNERAGHIPGAVLVPADTTCREDGTFKSPAELRALYADHGVTENKDIITYCTVGGRASQAWFLPTHVLGYPSVRVYDGSWAEWGTRPDTPVAL